MFCNKFFVGRESFIRSGEVDRIPIDFSSPTLDSITFVTVVELGRVSVLRGGMGIRNGVRQIALVVAGTVVFSFAWLLLAIVVILYLFWLTNHDLSDHGQGRAR